MARSKDRGAYRAIKVVLLDGPDFQRLSRDARWVFVTLKLSMGPSGIEVHYPEALVHELADKTGSPPDDVRAALDELESGGWIRRERNVVWIVGQLEHDPSLQVTNGNHRSSIQQHVAGLPRLPIVQEFVRNHPEWFPPSEYADSEGLDDGTPMPSPMPSPMPPRSPNTEYRIPKTEDREEKPPREAVEVFTPEEVDPDEEDPPPDSGWIHPTKRMSGSQILQAWENHSGVRIPEGQRAKHREAARQIADKHTTEEVQRAMVGMTKLFPHCPPKCQPWDLRDLDNKFAKALAAFESQPERRAAREAARFLAAGGAA